MLEIKNLHANINGKEILKGINLVVNPGEVHAIMGPNGSGKSTLSSVIAGNPAFEVTEGEIVESITRPLGARDLDGVKRRTRSGMGRCQMGFCTPKIMEILARELKVDVTNVTKNGPGSEVVVGKVK